jgi:hypothetical protein
MNTLQKSVQFALVIVAVIGLFAVAAPQAHAYSYEGDCCGSFDSAFGGGYDSWYDGGFDSAFGGGYDSTYTPGYDSYYEPGYDSYYTPGYDSYYEPGYDSYYEPGYDSTYTPGYGSSYSESPVYYGSSGEMYSSSGGYSTGGRSVSYPPTAIPPRQQQPIFSIVPIGQPTGGQTQTQAQTQTSTNVNENQNVNTSNSNSNAVVSNSGNSTNNINVVVNVPQQQAPVTPVYQLPVVQYPIQYVTPQQPVYPAPFCTISISNGYNSGYNGSTLQATLTWSSTNATSAFISPNVGSVSVSGTRVVNGIGSQTYTMTVYGQNGQTATCQTFYTYTPAPVAPYVSLSQIPYTGFDLGATATAIYWASLIAFALAAGYLMIYFRGGVFALSGNMIASRAHVAEKSDEVIVAPAPVVASVKEDTAPAMSFNLPVTSSRHVTSDTMTVTPDGRLVINRS